MKNRNGKWIIGYNKFLGSYSVNEAKMWCVLDGLNILIYCGLDNVMIQFDSLLLVMTI